jgi:hypothetical protein
VVLHQGLTEVQRVPEFATRQSQVRLNLFAVSGRHLLHGLGLEDDLPLNHDRPKGHFQSLLDLAALRLGARLIPWLLSARPGLELNSFPDHGVRWEKKEMGE